MKKYTKVMTDRASFSRLLQHRARKQRRSIITPRSHSGLWTSLVSSVIIQQNSDLQVSVPLAAFLLLYTTMTSSSSSSKLTDTRYTGCRRWLLYASNCHHYQSLQHLLTAHQCHCRSASSCVSFVQCFHTTIIIIIVC